MSQMIKESPISAFEGEILPYTLTWQGASALSSPTGFIYYKGADVSSAGFLTGSHSVSGNVQTLKTITFATAWVGNYIDVYFKCVVDSNTEIRHVKIYVQKLGAS